MHVAQTLAFTNVGKSTGTSRSGTASDRLLSAL